MIQLPRTKSELAHYLGVSLSTIKRWLKQQQMDVPRGIIPPKKMRQIILDLGYDHPAPPSKRKGPS
ncbi:MAG: hypothetical protein ACKOAY_11005 [Haliscomenobacter sp.]